MSTQQHGRRPLAALVPIVLTLAVVGCGAPGMLSVPVTPSASPSPSSGATAEARPGQPEPAPTSTATAPLEPTGASVPPPSEQTPPPVLPRPGTVPRNPYHYDPTWLEDEPSEASSLAGPTVDVYIACAEWSWSVRVEGVEYDCQVPDAGHGIDHQLPIIAITGVPITAGQAPRIEQQRYAPWDPAERWATVVIVDPGVVPTAAVLGARIEGPVRVSLACPPGEDVISFGQGHDACHYGGTFVDVGPLPDPGPLAVPAPVAYVPLHPGSATFYGAR